MKILAVSDVVLPQMQDAVYLERTYQDVSLLVSCGDMAAGYLDFIGSILCLPLMFVRGNHDGSYQPGHPGGDNLHGRIMTIGEHSFAGLEGSIRYNQGPVQYTDREMFARVLWMLPRLLVSESVRGHGVDAFITHSPPQGIHDIPEDRAHRGFKAFHYLMRWARPRYLLHGHVDTWDRRQAIQTVFYRTAVVNINPVTVLDLGEAD
ncbi:metallophosphoesterase family protein [Aggregatilinea lenta]|uniref:metallophosphoesterase family protein n=1 Tax=Aggregatilinea lenta TaxID=913108 RepID=UPI000E5C5369|nr:metallophosphoesterase [Aggregatilinea lenta]